MYDRLECLLAQWTFGLNLKTNKEKSILLVVLYFSCSYTVKYQYYAAEYTKVRNPEKKKL